MKKILFFLVMSCCILPISYASSSLGSSINLSSSEFQTYIDKGYISSDKFTSFNECSSQKDKYNLEYSSYKRSSCFETEGKFQYFICNLNESCIINKMIQSEGTESTQTEQSQQITLEGTGSKIPYQEKLDKFISKLSSMRETTTPEKFKKTLDNVVGKLNLLEKKYSSNTTIKSMVVYLNNGVKGLYEQSDIDDFFCELTGGCNEVSVTPSVCPQYSPSQCATGQTSYIKETQVLENGCSKPIFACKLDSNTTSGSTSGEYVLKNKKMCGPILSDGTQQFSWYDSNNKASELIQTCSKPLNGGLSCNEKSGGCCPTGQVSINGNCVTQSGVGGTCYANAQCGSGLSCNNNNICVGSTSTTTTTTSTSTTTSWSIKSQGKDTCTTLGGGNIGNDTRLKSAVCNVGDVVYQRTNCTQGDIDDKEIYSWTYYECMKSTEANTNTISKIEYVNLVHGGGIAACNQQIVDKFGTQKYSCKIGGGCSLSGGIPTASNPSANPNAAGACIPKIDWDNAVPTSSTNTSCVAQTINGYTLPARVNGGVSVLTKTVSNNTYEQEFKCNSGTWSLRGNEIKSTNTNTSISGTPTPTPNSSGNYIKHDGLGKFQIQLNGFAGCRDYYSTNDKIPEIYEKGNFLARLNGGYSSKLSINGVFTSNLNISSEPKFRDMYLSILCREKIYKNDQGKDSIDYSTAYYVLTPKKTTTITEITTLEKMQIPGIEKYLTREKASATGAPLICTEKSIVSKWYKEKGRCPEQAGIDYWNGQIKILGAEKTKEHFIYAYDENIKKNSNGLDGILCPSGYTYIKNTEYCEQK